MGRIEPIDPEHRHPASLCVIGHRRPHRAEADHEQVRALHPPKRRSRRWISGPTTPGNGSIEQIVEALTTGGPQRPGTSAGSEQPPLPIPHRGSGFVNGFHHRAEVRPHPTPPGMALAEAFRAARRLHVLGRPPAVPDIEYHPHRWRSHTQRRDAAAIRHHYDVSNAFYSMILGPSMTYSCARFAEPNFDLEQAQASKHEHICRKLGLHEAPQSRLLDVGCGWGSLAIHAATHHGTRVVGINYQRRAGGVGHTTSGCGRGGAAGRDQDPGLPRPPG